MNGENIGIFGLVREYPEFKYSTKEMMDILGNKLSEKVKENVLQLGVENRHFIRSLDHYVSKTGEPTKLIHDLEQSQISVKMLQKNAYQI